MQALRPFVWRKDLDFAALEDIHSIKRQIHAAKGGKEIEFFGHDLKTGHGGIREIEFLAQTQQLILGGKNIELRTQRTLDTLAGLNRHHHLSEAVLKELTEAYVYLREVEHRIQMINDEQTHKIPANEDDVARLAAFLGEESSSQFQTRLTTVLQSTHAQFAELFEKEERLSTDAGSLIFTGVENNSETIASLSALGFKRPEAVSDAVRGWHAGSLRATRSTRARELLTKLTPKLLERLAAASDPDDAFIAFERFLSRLPSGVQIFSMFASSPEIFDRLSQIMTVAPSLGTDLAKRRHLVEALLEHAWPPALPNEEEFSRSLCARLDRAQSHEEKLNAARRWASEEKFQISAQLVLGLISTDVAASSFSLIADVVISLMLPVAQAEMEAQHGTIEGGLVVVGLGRLGSRSMTASSDIDLIFIYDAPDCAMSTGEKPLDSVRYFARLVRRIVTALTAMTEEGALYDVDMQLRPSGGAGPAAVSKAAFVRYFTSDAWTWEVMALTKARIIAGESGLSSFVEEEVERIISRPRSCRALANDVHDMRQRIRDAKATKWRWDVKNLDGGLTDIDFIHQFLQLKTGKRFALSGDILTKSANLSTPMLEPLLTISVLFENIIQLSRAATGSTFKPEGSGIALKERMHQACFCESMDEAEKLIERSQSAVKDIYARVIECELDSEESGEKRK